MPVPVPEYLIIYHAGCYDGFCAAWIARCALHCHLADGRVAFKPAQYGQPRPTDAEVAGKYVFILDFSYPKAELLEMADLAMHVYVFDHHKTAKEDLEEFTKLDPYEAADKAAGIPPRYTNITVKFDMEKSGARLAWEYFYGEERFPNWLVNYTEDRDLWRHALPDTKEINAGLRSYPFDFELWDNLAQISELGRLREEGRGILRAQRQLIDQHIHFAFPLKLDEYDGLCVNATTQNSEIAGELAKKADFGCVFFTDKAGSVIYNLRSRDEKVCDVGALAKRFGGGGHACASGFTRKGIDNAMVPFSDLVMFSPHYIGVKNG